MSAAVRVCLLIFAVVKVFRAASVIGSWRWCRRSGPVASWNENFRDLSASIARMATLRLDGPLDRTTG